MTTTKRILIVEDDIQIQQIYEFKLHLSGYEVRTASNGMQGFEIAKEFMPDLILLDVRMPVMNGEEMLSKLRTEDWGASMRIIILTNISKDEVPRNLRFLGVDRFIVKAHHTPSQVIEIVQEVLGR